MNQNRDSDILNTLAYNMMTENYIFPFCDKDGNWSINDDKILLHSVSHAEQFTVQILDGDSITSDQLLANILRTRDMILENRFRRNRPIIMSYLVFLSRSNYVECINFIKPYQSEIEREDVGISISFFQKGFPETQTLHANRKRQKDLISCALSVYSNLLSDSEMAIYSKADIVNYYEQTLSKVKNIGKIKGFSVTKAIIAINVIIFLIGIFTVQKYGVDITHLYGSQIGFVILDYHEYWRLITPIFLHADLMHLASNAYFLYICGELVESFYGKTKFIIIYLLTGIAGNVLSLFLLNPDTPSLGASGACMGLGGIITYLWFSKKHNFRKHFVNMKSFIFIILFNVVYGFLLPHLNINNWAHMGGFAAGILAGLLIDIFPTKSSKNQFGG